MSKPLPLVRKLEVQAIAPAGRIEHIVASPAELAGIAKAYGLLEAKAVSADLTLERNSAGDVRIEGRILADIVQECVVSFVPVEQKIDEEVQLRLVPEGSPKAPAPAPGAEVRIERDVPDPPDTYSGTSIDLGALVLEHMVLAIDPYPRAPGVELPATTDDTGTDPAASPFAVLSGLKPKQS